MIYTNPEMNFFPLLIGHGLYALVGEGPFFIIGTPEVYAEISFSLCGQKHDPTTFCSARS